MSRARLYLGCLVGASLAGCAHRAATPPTPVPKAVVPAAAVQSAPGPPPRVIRILRPKGEEPSPIFSVQVRGDRVYFNDGAGRLWSAPKDGSRPAVALVDDAHDSVRSFVIEKDGVYYAARQAIRRVPLAGGPTTTWSEVRSGPILLVSDGEHVYHTVFDGSGTFRASLATGRSERFCVGGKHQTLAVDEHNLYVASYFAGTITAISKKTRKARVLASGARRPVRLITDATYVYFASESDGTVRRVAKTGGRVEVLARGQKAQEHLAIDGTHVYWAARQAGGGAALLRARSIPEPAVAPEQLYAGLTSAAGVTVDDAYVYVADRGAGEVVRVRKTE